MRLRVDREARRARKQQAREAARQTAKFHAIALENTRADFAAKYRALETELINKLERAEVSKQEYNDILRQARVKWRDLVRAADAGLLKPMPVGEAPER